MLAQLKQSKERQQLLSQLTNLEKQEQATFLLLLLQKQQTHPFTIKCNGIQISIVRYRFLVSKISLKIVEIYFQNSHSPKTK